MRNISFNALILAIALVSSANAGGLAKEANSTDQTSVAIEVSSVDLTLAPGIYIGVEGTRIDISYVDENGKRVYTFLCAASTRTCYYIDVSDNGTSTAVTGYWGDETVAFHDEGIDVEHDMYGNYGVVTVTY